MNKKERTREIVLQLKQIKEERGLTCADIHEMLVEAGEDLSPASVRRVFSEGSEDQGFRFRGTIQPIARVMLGITEEGEAMGPAEADALKNVALLKDAMIQELQKEVDSLKAKTLQLEHELALATDRVEFLKGQIVRKDDYIDRLAKKAGL